MMKMTGWWLIKIIQISMHFCTQKKSVNERSLEEQAYLKNITLYLYFQSQNKLMSVTINLICYEWFSSLNEELERKWKIDS